MPLFNNNRKLIKEKEAVLAAKKSEFENARNDLPVFSLSRPTDQPELEKDRNGFYKIVCPYCLTKFQIGDLLYRAAVVDDGNPDTTEATFECEPDLAFENHWQSVGTVNMDSNLPHILSVDPADGEISSVTLLKKDGERDAHVTIPYNENAMEEMKRNKVVYVTDKHGHMSASRICPHCHTEIPSELGFVPNYIFSMLGNSGCGKTVYLYRLVQSLCGGQFMSSSYQGTVINDESNVLEEKTINQARRVFEANGQRMIDATDMGYIRPVIIRLINKKTLDRIYITLFDFPGEGIWRTEDSFFVDLAHKNFMNSNGWLFMFDAGTLPFVNRKLPTEVRQVDLDDQSNAELIADPATILNQVFEAYGFGQAFTKPVAFILSKSDMIRECLTHLEGKYVSGDPLFLCNPAPHSKLNMSDLFLCDEEIRNMLMETSVTTDGDLFCQRDCAWFAISSTTVPLINGRIEEGAQPSGLRDTGPLEWLLYRCGQLEAEKVKPEDPRSEEITDWATGFQIMDMDGYHRKVQRCMDLNSEIQSLERELNSLKN